MLGKTDFASTKITESSASQKLTPKIL